MKKFWDEKKARMSWNKTLKKNDFCALFRVLNRKTHDQRGFYFVEVVWGGIEPPTQGFSVLCSTN